MFGIALTNVLITIFYILPGYVIRKIHVVKEQELGMASGILVYIGTPFLILSAFLDMDFSWGLMGELGLFFLISLACQGAFLGILWLLFRKKFSHVYYRLLCITSELGNVGFFGIPIVRALFPNNPETSCYCTMYMMSMNVIAFTIGTYCLTEDKKYISLKSAIFNPTTLGIVVALPMYMIGARHFLPAALLNGIRALGGLCTPLAMIILGIRLASAPVTDIFKNKMVYPAVFLKLILFPLFAYAVVLFLPLPASFKATILVLSSTPGAAITLSLAELHHSETKMAANILILSTVLCFITIPLLTLLIP